MSWCKEDYFLSVPDAFRSIISDFEEPWNMIAGISEQITQLIAQSDAPEFDLSSSASFDVDDNLGVHQALHIMKTAITAEPIKITNLNIFIGKGVKLERTAIIYPNTYICDGSEIRQCAYIRGGVLIGEKCVIGHTTEIKNSIMIHHVEAGHFSYIGDSIIGSYVNLGAGSILYNLNFRSLHQKQNEEFPQLKFETPSGQLVDGAKKFGAIIGDGSELGCNCVVTPCTFIGHESRILPCLCVRKGNYPPHSFLK